MKRRERLKAMRMEASQTEASNAAESHALPSCLSNPFVESSANVPVQKESHSIPRFDFYTDPMSAFSGNKKTMAGNQTSQGYYTPPITSGSPMAQTSSSPSGTRTFEMSPRPANQFQPNYSPDQRIFPAPGTRNPQMTPSSANQFQTNYSPDQRIYHAPGTRPAMPPSPTNQFQTNYSPDQRIYHEPGHYHGSGPHKSPLEMARPFPSYQGTPPGPWNESGPSASYGVRPNVSTDGNFPNPGFGRVGSPSFGPGQGRGHWYGNGPSPGSGRGSSPSPNQGRGRDRWVGNNSNPGSGRSGGRGRGSHEFVSAQDRPDRFYNKSMVEDPWQFLEPVVWRSMNSMNSWLPKSIRTKKAKVSETFNQSNSQFSLAEYLAASFNEAVEDAESA